MKKAFYLSSVLLLLCVSCQDTINDSDVDTGGTDNTRFSLLIPEYKVLNTRSVSSENNLQDVSLLLFDANGLFLGRQQATNLSVVESGGTGSGSFDAQIPAETYIIHFVANYNDWNSFDERGNLGKDERELIPQLVSHNLTFWGRTERTSQTTINALLYRNQAKVTVENNAAGFEVTGYALANFLTSGTVAPFATNATPTPFMLETTPTVPSGTLTKGNQTQSDCDLTAKYMFPNVNPFTDQTYTILKGKLNGGTELYYKIQFLDENKVPFPIVRNNDYKIKINSFNGNANGSTSFEDAKNAPPSNNIYAEILKESKTISDNNNNTLIVGGTSYLFITGGTLNIPAHYFINGVETNAQISVTKVQDDSSILSNLQYNAGTATITASVASIPAGQQYATLQVKAGTLTRTITIISSAAYSLNPVALSPSVYTAKDQDVKLSFNIPSTIPLELFPLDFYITTKNLYPVSPDNNMLVDLENGIDKYIYEAVAPGIQNVSFKTSLENSDETISIKNGYFTTASINLQARHFTNASINTNSNIVNYGTGTSAVLNFNLTDITGNNVEYPLTVTVKTNNLQTTQSGWNAVTGGYTRTFNSAPAGQQTVNFTTNKPISKESIVLSASGFAPTTLTYDNKLTQNIAVGGNIRVFRSGVLNSFTSSATITSSNTDLVNSFKTATQSKYTLTIKSGALLTDMVTFSATVQSVNYYASFTIEQLLASPDIILR